MASQTLHDFEMKTIDGAAQKLGAYAGQVVLVVNVASKCGLTPHYTGLQKLQEEYGSRGFSVLGFPCNQFGGQEPGSDAEVKTFSSAQYGVSFPMFSKIEVNGAGRAPLYAWLTAEATEPDGPGDVAWNFAKFVIGKDGRVRARFGPATEPDSAELRDVVEAALSD